MFLLECARRKAISLSGLRAEDPKSCLPADWDCVQGFAERRSPLRIRETGVCLELDHSCPSHLRDVCRSHSYTITVPSCNWSWGGQSIRHHDSILAF